MKLVCWAALASGPAALALWWVSALSPSAVESVYSRVLYPTLAAPLSRLVGLIPPALSPWFLLALLVAAVALFFGLPFVRALSLLGAGASVLLAWFVLGWGLNYQRQSWAENHGLEIRASTVEALASLAERVEQRVNALRATLPQPSQPWSGTELGRAVNGAYQRAAASDPLLAGQWGPPKLFPFPHALSWLGISGIYLPFLTEPLVNPGPADWQLPFTAAHEAAHLRGWAREDEANFLAFLVLQDDPDPLLAYSAWGSALLYLASALESSPEGRRAWERLASRLDPAVRSDWKTSFAYWEKYRGPARQAAEAVNDAYLKSQGQSDGVKSYGRMVELLLAWETRSSPEQRSPGPPPPAPR